MTHNVRTFTAYTPDGNEVEVSTFVPDHQDRWDTLTYLVKMYPQLDGWGYARDSVWTQKVWTQKEGM